MKYFALLAPCIALVLAGCATSPTKFYADRSKPDATSLCRAVFDESADTQFRRDVAEELTRRGVTFETCQQKISTQNAVGAAAVIIGLGAATVIACQNTNCAGAGGSLGGGGVARRTGYAWDGFYDDNGVYEFRCRSYANGEFVPDYLCPGPQVDNWP